MSGRDTGGKGLGRKLTRDADNMGITKPAIRHLVLLAAAATNPKAMLGLESNIGSGMTTLPQLASATIMTCTSDIAGDKPLCAGQTTEVSCTASKTAACNWVLETTTARKLLTSINLRDEAEALRDGRM